MAITKHIGKHANRDIILLWRKVPNEEHMCLVLYPDQLPSLYLDTVRRAVQSPVGQGERNFADALDRESLPDGRRVLQALHKDGYIKKVASSNIIMVANPKTQHRLDELNKIIDQVEQGEDAVKKLEAIDNSSGFQYTKELTQPVLDDAAIARQRLAQAERMTQEAKNLLEEAARLQEEAKQLQGGNATEE